MTLPRLVKPCSEFSPRGVDAALCFCGIHWVLHPDAAKAAFMSNATQENRSRLVEACMRDNAVKCSGYTPEKDVAKGEGLPPCGECGRPARVFHDNSSVIKGMKAYREARQVKPPCGKFWATGKAPGECAICQRRWIDHSEASRGRLIEDLEHIHQLWCKCIQVPGGECSCMTDQKAQLTLDQMGERVACKSFKAKSIGNTTCGACGEAFYRHSISAVDGFTAWIDWRQHHMNQTEILTWFMSLGTDRPMRIYICKQILSDPNFNHPTIRDKSAPDHNTIKAILEAITGETLDAKTVLAAATDEEIANDRGYVCYSCGEMHARVEGAICQSCAENYVRNGSKATIEELTNPNADLKDRESERADDDGMPPNVEPGSN